MTPGKLNVFNELLLVSYLLSFDDFVIGMGSLSVAAVLFVKVFPCEIGQTEDEAKTVPQEVCCLFALSACHNNVSFIFLLYGGDQPHLLLCGCGNVVECFGCCTTGGDDHPFVVSQCG